MMNNLNSTDTRLGELQHWLRDELGLKDFTMQPASSDASFRRYFRVIQSGRTFIAMDAPPEREDCAPYITAARAFAAQGVNVPRVLEAELARGFLLLTDLGARQYLQELSERTVERLYQDALRALHLLQAGALEDAAFPPYDHALLMQEMKLFSEWLLQRHLGIAAHAEILEPVFDLLAESALEQPRVWVHRDFHSRNLMVVDQANPGVLDFQDAVIGPVTYDLVSLLRDCYVAWPTASIDRWAAQFYNDATRAGTLTRVGLKQFMRWFDLMGVQRHLKAAGIFARLNYRDAKPGYMQDIPRVLRYIEEVSGRYPELVALHGLIRDAAAAGGR